MNTEKSIIKVGDIVRYASEWCSPGERKYLHIVIESYEDIKRCKIKTLNSSLMFAPVEYCDFDMLEKTEFNAETWISEKN